MDKIFVSYSHKDRFFAREIVRLLSEAYDKVWYDEKIELGIKWEKEIERRIADCDHFIFMVSRESLESDVCRWELQLAYDYDRHIIPVLLRGSIDESESISAHQMLNMTDGITISNINRLYATLIRRLMKNLHRRDLLQQLRNNLLPDLVDEEDFMLPSLPTLPGDEYETEPATTANNRLIVLRKDEEAANASIKPFQSFVQQLVRWDEEPWMIIGRLHGTDKESFMALSDDEQRKIYDAFQDMLRVAHQFVAQYEELFQIVNHYLPGMGAERTGEDDEQEDHSQAAASE